MPPRDILVENKKLSETGFVYTPGLKIKRSMKVLKVRRLPVAGDVLVKVGDKVSYDTVVAKTTIPGDPIFVKCSTILGVEPNEITRFMVKKVDDFVKENELLAKYDAFFGIIKKRVHSPIDGNIELISELTGQIVVRREPKPVSISAYIPGNVIEVMPNEGVMINTSAAFIQGIFGVGGEKHGKLKVLVNSRNETLTAHLISEHEKNCIIVGGSDVTFEALEIACKIGVAGIIVGGIEYSNITKLLGRHIGVTITGEEDISTTILITEGFGKMAISEKSFNLIKEFEGHTVCINGTTQIRAGVIRPELIIPHYEEEVISESEYSKGILIGTTVRIIAEPYFGAIGKVTLLPGELQRIESESEVRILCVELHNGKLVQVPRANVEILEE